MIIENKFLVGTFIYTSKWKSGVGKGKYTYSKGETIPEPVFQNGKLFPGNFSKMENSSQTNLLNCTQL